MSFWPFSVFHRFVFSKSKENIFLHMLECFSKREGATTNFLDFLPEYKWGNAKIRFQWKFTIFLVRARFLSRTNFVFQFVLNTLKSPKITVFVQKLFDFASIPISKSVNAFSKKRQKFSESACPCLKKHEKPDFTGAINATIFRSLNAKNVVF